ncbi:hypothetical protein FB45DRAFT_1010064 [Roridomyces roridus]|uniref:Uncharacterized protein n=1 Tax=Roridomyces roridus TaxID=1738132 RepID=A0AAD7B516_9AGAR|nr:hypothetical protein FB45DRAFT_1010064 [Roridomyces roridus]
MPGTASELCKRFFLSSLRPTSVHRLFPDPGHSEIFCGDGGWQWRKWLMYEFFAFTDTYHIQKHPFDTKRSPPPREIHFEPRQCTVAQPPAWHTREARRTSLPLRLASGPACCDGFSEPIFVTSVPCYAQLVTCTLRVPQATGECHRVDSHAPGTSWAAYPAGMLPGTDSDAVSWHKAVIPTSGRLSRFGHFWTCLAKIFPMSPKATSQTLPALEELMYHLRKYTKPLRWPEEEELGFGSIRASDIQVSGA